MFGKKIITIKNVFPADTPDLAKTAREYVSEELIKLGIGKKLMLRSALLTEETVIQFQRFAREGAFLHIKIKRFLGDTSVVLSMEGDEFDPYAEEKEDLDDEEEITENTVRAILLRSYGEAFKYSHRNRLNTVRILTGRSEQRSLRITLIALVLGILFGVFAKLVLPEAATAAICSDLFEPVKTMFLKALQIVIAPVVFFSIASCISQFGNLMELGRIGLKVIGIYLLTSAIAICLGMGAANLIQPGEPGFALSLASEDSLGQLGEGVDLSVKNIFINIIPKNFIEPFYDSDTLQIIFLAVICGIAVGMTGEHSSKLRSMFDTLNSLFLTVTTIISRFIPVAVFCSLGLLIMKVGGSELLSVLSGVGVHILTIMAMICIYGLLILIIARINPLNFYRKGKEGMLTSFALSSSSAAMPTNMRVCTDKLGISPKICSFSIPLGATINMDGVCIFLSIMSMFLARAYGVTVTFSGVMTAAVTIMLLSLGAPGVPGSALVCLSVVLRSLNVPIEAIGLIIAVNPIMDMFDTMNNTTGDMAAALIVAKKENLLDEQVYRS